MSVEDIPFEDSPVHVRRCDRLLYIISRQGRINFVRPLIDMGADVNAPCGPNGETPFLVAWEQGYFAIAKTLIEHGADINACAGMALTNAIRTHDEEGAQWLFAHGAQASWPGEGPLIVAASEGNTDMVKLLLSHGADINAKDVNGRSVLMNAIKLNNEASVQFLLSQGADVNAVDTFGMSSLFLAVSLRLTPIARLLLQNGSDVDTTLNTGETALMCAVAYGQRNMVQVLLEWGADPNLRQGGPHGKTALWQAVITGDAKIIDLLLEHNADISATYNDTDTATTISNDPDQSYSIIDVATASGHSDVHTLLKSVFSKSVFDVG